VIAIDQIPSRLRMAEKAGGRGADSCIDGDGLEAHGHTLGVNSGGLRGSWA
jgi:hypothetical protein